MIKELIQKYRIVLVEGNKLQFKYIQGWEQSDIDLMKSHKQDIINELLGITKPTKEEVKVDIVETMPEQPATTIEQVEDVTVEDTVEDLNDDIKEDIKEDKVEEKVEEIDIIKNVKKRGRPAKEVK